MPVDVGGVLECSENGEQTLHIPLLFTWFCVWIRSDQVLLQVLKLFARQIQIFCRCDLIIESTI